MHYHCEIVMPHTDVPIEEAIAAIMAPFDENHKPSDEDKTDARHAFWDFYSIGGRWAGRKLMASFDQKKIEEFYSWLSAEKVTVSGLTCGKQELSPSSQIPKVDAKWNEMFPAETPLPCPIFKHSNDQYCKSADCALPNDVLAFSDTPASLKCDRVIFCQPSDKFGPVRANFMLTDTAWNGCNHMPVSWDETFGDAVRQYMERMDSYGEEFKKKITPTTDWLVVTVDYHS